MAAMPRSVPAQTRSQELPVRVRGPNHLCYLLILSQVHEQGTGWEVEQPELTAVSMWNTDVTDDSLNTLTSTEVLFLAKSL